MPLATAPTRVEIVCNAGGALADARRLAALTGLPLHTDIDPDSAQAPLAGAYLLIFDGSGVCLRRAGRRAPGAVRAEFALGRAGHRRRFGGGAGQLIARAVGIGPGRRPSVIDATAGLGSDAFVLASLGCPVLLLERSPLVHALLVDGLARAREPAAADPGLAAALVLMSPRLENALDYLQALQAPHFADVIYLDPMFPERSKSASVKKEMRAFHDVVGRDEDAAELLALALSRVRHRVVVKRPRKAAAIAGPPPGFVLAGKSSRYDIYAVKKMG